MPTHTLRILHLSDLHDRGPRETESWRRRRVLGDAWVENLKVIQEDGGIDLMAFTGDAADWGRTVEFGRATDFLGETLEKLGLPWDRFFTVPGNHDIDREIEPAAWDLRPRILRQPRIDASRWMNGWDLDDPFGSDLRERLLARQGAYRAWLAEIGREDLLPNGSHHPHLGYRATLRLKDFPFDFHVIGLDSAWLCGSKNESGNLLLTQDQIGRLCADPAGDPLPSFRLALVHHPLEDLADAAEARRLLGDRADLLLRGHLHEPEVSERADPDRKLRQVAAGCLYEGYGADQYPNACEVIEVHLNQEGRPLRYHLRFRGWSSRGHWYDDDSLYKESRGGRLVWKIRKDSGKPPLHPRVQEVFVGREAELQRLRDLLSTGDPAAPVAICAVQGMPGVGKSYLADRFALESSAAFPGGAVRLVLDPLKPTSAEALLHELADLLELPGGGDGLAGSVRERLRFPRTLLHVENVDSPTAEAAAAGLLRDLGRCAVVVTGRLARLGKGVGWRQVPIEPFSEDNALRQLARELERSLAEVETEEYRDLVRAVGFLPLAVHLAAGYLEAGGTPAGFLRKLRERGLDLAPLSTAELAVEGSQAARKVLKASFEISLEILREELKEKADCLLEGLYALGHAPLAGFGRSLGAAVAGLSEEDFEDLTMQAGRLSLLMPVPRKERPEGAWRVHPLLAEYLRAGAEAEAVQNRMTRWFLERLPWAGPTKDLEHGPGWREMHRETAALIGWLPSLTGEEALQAGITGGYYAERYGPYHLWLEYFEKHLTQPHLEPSHRSALLWGLILVCLAGGFPERGLDAARKMVDFEKNQGEAELAAVAWGAIADILEARGNLDEALRIRKEEELAVYEKVGNSRSRAVAMGKIASILQAQGDLDEALRIRKEEEIPVYEKLGDIRARAVTLGNIAGILQLQGDLDRALQIRQDEQIPIFDKIGDIRARAVTLGSGIARILQQKGQLDEAARLLQEEVIPVFEGLARVQDLVAARRHLASILLERAADGDREQAAELLGLALRDAERLRSPAADQIRAILAHFGFPVPEPAEG